MPLRHTWRLCVWTLLLSLGLTMPCAPTRPVRGQDVDFPPGGTTRPESDDREPAEKQVIDVVKNPCAMAESLIDTATSPIERCRSHLALARCVIVVKCASHLSRFLADDHADGSELAELARAGIKQLDQAAAALKSAEEDGESDSADLEQKIDLLRAFADVYAALADLSDSKVARDHLIEACGGLASYFDDSDKSIAESAKFWQGVAYRHAGKAERALQVLRPAIATPASGRIGLAARLERCRALADRGDHAAALALALRIAPRVDTWLDGEDAATRKAAAASVKRLRAELLRGWAKKLKADDQKVRAADALAEAKKLTVADEASAPFELAESIAGVPDFLPKQKAEPADDEDDEP